MKTRHDIVKEKVVEIENEMKRIGSWQSEPLPEEKYDFQAAFARDTMAFGQWLQFVFIPRVTSIVEERGAFPSSSSVGAQAIRELDGDHAAQRLVTLLCEFDALFG